MPRSLNTTFGIISDRIGRRPVLITGYIIFALIYLGFGLVHTVFGIWILFIVYGLYYATTEGIQKSYVADMVPEGQRGVAMGTFNALTGNSCIACKRIGRVFMAVIWCFRCEQYTRHYFCITYVHTSNITGAKKE